MAGGRKKDISGKGLQVEEKDEKREIAKPAETRRKQEASVSCFGVKEREVRGKEGGRLKYGRVKRS